MAIGLPKARQLPEPARTQSSEAVDVNFGLRDPGHLARAAGALAVVRGALVSACQ